MKKNSCARDLGERQRGDHSSLPPSKFRPTHLFRTSAYTEIKRENSRTQAYVLVISSLSPSKAPSAWDVFSIGSSISITATCYLPCRRHSEYILSYTSTFQSVNLASSTGYRSPITEERLGCDLRKVLLNCSCNRFVWSLQFDNCGISKESCSQHDNRF